ncbi:MAG: hypothetical protein AAGI34_12575 [Pseudomonadota bacterium]
MVTIRVDFARARLIDSAKTETFVNEIRKLQDALSFSRGRADPRPRFSQSTIALLSRELIARGPGLRDAIFQVTHLMRAAASVSPSGSALEVLFTLEGPAQPRHIAAGLAPWFANSEHATLTDKALCLTYADTREPYELTFTRLPLVLALVEFALGMELDDNTARERDAVMRRLETSAPRLDAQREASNALARVLSGYLDQALGARAARERLIAVARYLDEHAEAETPGQPPLWHLDDEAVLGFWETQAETGASEMRLYRTVHRAFIALILALRHGRDWHALHEGLRDFDALPVESALDPAAVAGEAAGSALDALAEPPLDTVKFLNKREREALELVDLYWRQTGELALSVLRSAVMGRHQSALTTARQFGRPLAPLLSLAEAPGYGAQIEEWQSLAKHLERMRLASAHVLAHHAGLDLPARADEARKAFQSFRRAGFSEALDDPELGRAFGAAIAPLVTLSEQLDGLQTALSSDLDRIETADRPRFEQALRTIYAETETT